MGGGLLLAALVSSAVSFGMADPVSPRAITVAPVILELTGPLNDPRAEVSGMTWKGDTLVIMPQNPTLFAGAGSMGFFAIHRSRILAAIDGTVEGPILPRQVNCLATGMSRIVKGFDGLEAMGLIGDRCYMTVEAEEDTVMSSYLVSGKYDMVNNEVVMDMTKLTSIPMGLNIPNIAEESIVIDGGQVITISEANGLNVNPSPVGKVFNTEIEFQGTIPFPQIEYRVTDATEVGEDGRFWVINYFFPREREKLNPAPDPELECFGDLQAYDPDICVERLLEMRIVRTCLQGDFIARTDTPPVNLALLLNGECRNWEAVVRLGDMGFLMMTDEYPGTLLAFVPYDFASPKN